MKRERIQLNVSTQVVTRTWRPALNADQILSMRVLEESVQHNGWVLCSEADWQTYKATGLVPARRLIYRLEDIISIDGAVVALEVPT